MVLEGGLVATYRQAGKTTTAAYDDPTAENFHEWRKQAKYHGYHMNLLRELWKPVMRSLEKEADELSELLGDDHNLDVFHRTLLKSPNKYGKKRVIQVLLGLIDRRSAELRVEAKTIGGRIFAEKPKAFGRYAGSGFWDRRKYGTSFAFACDLMRSNKYFGSRSEIVCVQGCRLGTRRAHSSRDRNAGSYRASPRNFAQRPRYEIVVAS